MMKNELACVCVCDMCAHACWYVTIRARQRERGKGALLVYLLLN